MDIKRMNELREAKTYEAPSVQMLNLSLEGLLCESVRQIENFELLEETDW